MIFEVWAQDRGGRNELAGYGVCHVRLFGVYPSPLLSCLSVSVCVAAWGLYKSCVGLAQMPLCVSLAKMPLCVGLAMGWLWFVGSIKL